MPSGFLTKNKNHDYQLIHLSIITTMGTNKSLEKFRHKKLMPSFKMKCLLLQIKPSQQHQQQTIAKQKKRSGN